MTEGNVKVKSEEISRNFLSGIRTSKKFQQLPLGVTSQRRSAPAASVTEWPDYSNNIWPLYNNELLPNDIKKLPK